VEVIPFPDKLARLASSVTDQNLPLNKPVQGLLVGRLRIPASFILQGQDKLFAGQIDKERVIRGHLKPVKRQHRLLPVEIPTFRRINLSPGLDITKEHKGKEHPPDCRVVYRRRKPPQGLIHPGQ